MYVGKKNFIKYFIFYINMCPDKIQNILKLLTKNKHNNSVLERFRDKVQECTMKKRRFHLRNKR